MKLKKKVLAVVLAVIFLFTSIPMTIEAVVEKTLKMTISGDEYSNDISNLPVLVKLTPDRIDYNVADQNSLHFYMQGSQSESLKYEVEKWDETGESYVWVNVPLIKAHFDTVLCMDLGGTKTNETIYSDDYKLVEHFEETAGNITDSTSSAYVGTCRDVNFAQEGVVGNGLGFETTKKSQVLYENGFIGDKFNALTVSTFVKMNQPTTYFGLVSRDVTGGQKPGEVFAIGTDNNKWLGKITTDNGSANGLQKSLTTEYQAGYHMISITYDGVNLILYVDGAEKGRLATTGTLIDGTNLTKLTLGSYFGDYGYLTGTLDELVISNQAFSPEKLKAMYLSTTNQLLTYEMVEKNNDWAISGCDNRVKILIQNDQTEAFTDATVLVKIPANLVSNKNSISFFSEDNLKELPYEIEEWNQTSDSYIWIKTDLNSSAQTAVWMYFGNSENTTDLPQSVWADDFLFVEHFEKDESPLIDSKHTNTAAITGAPVYSKSNIANSMVFDGNTKLTYGNVAQNSSSLTVSAIVDTTSISGWVCFAGRDLYGGTMAGEAFFLGSDGSSVYARIFTNKQYSISAPLTAGSHLTTMSYDGAKLKLIIDGVEKASADVTGLIPDAVDNNVPLVVGAYSNAALSGAYKGNLDEVIVKNTSNSVAFEKFRTANYYGNIITILPTENKDGSAVLHITNIQNNDTIEAGNVIVSGYLSKDSALTYSINNGAVMQAGTFAAGQFSFSTEYLKVGQYTVAVKAEGFESSVSFSVVDTVAPAAPTSLLPANNSEINSNSTMLTAQINQNESETLTAQFYQNKISNANLSDYKIYSGETDSALPDGVPSDTSLMTDITQSSLTKIEHKDSSSISSDSSTKNPYQVFEVKISEQNLHADNFNLTWNGQSNREVSIFVWNTVQSKWQFVKSGYNNGEAVEILVSIANQNVLTGNIIKLLVWRGMTDPIENRSTYVASEGQYDFSLLWSTDPQFYAEREVDYPLFTNQMQWIADNSAKMKSKLLINTGDIVNVWNSDAQWQRMDNAYKIIENANIPYTLITGNHDVNNGNYSYFNQYFPASRMNKGKYFGGENQNYKNNYQLINESGVKIIILSLGYGVTQTDVDWATAVLNQYSGYSAILAVHDYLTAAGAFSSGYDNTALIRDGVVSKCPNIKMVLSGHWHGANTKLDTYNGNDVYAVLSDYQNLSQGGQGFMRFIKFDLENNLVYFNTYSPYYDVYNVFKDKQADKKGLYQLNKDEFALNIDFNATVNRELSSDMLTVSTDTSEIVSDNVSLSGSGTVSSKWENLQNNSQYKWFVQLTDESGNVTKSEVQDFTTNYQDDQASANLGTDVDTVFVESNDVIKAFVTIDDVINTNVFRVKMEYASSVLEVTDTKVLIDDCIFTQTINQDGSVVVLFGTKEYQNFSNNKQIVEVTFKVKQAAITSTHIVLTKVESATKSGDTVVDVLMPITQKDCIITIKSIKELCDLNHDTIITLSDLSIALANYTKDGAGDVNQDGTVDTSDLIIIAGYIA